MSALSEPSGQPDGSDSRVRAERPSSGERALWCLIGGTHPQSELTSLIETIFSSREAVDLANCLQESDAQTFIDVLHEVCCQILIDVAADLQNLYRLWRAPILSQIFERNV